jgi:hypothetical protein
MLAVLARETENGVGAQQWAQESTAYWQPGTTQSVPGEEDDQDELRRLVR